jgi:hypothetical protein
LLDFRSISVEVNLTATASPLKAKDLSFQRMAARLVTTRPL